MMLTEQRNSRSAHIDQLSAFHIVQLMNAEDASVAAAVREALPAIAEAVETIAARLRAGGRLIYVGAGTSGRLAVLDAAECVPTFSTDPTLVQALIAGGMSALTHAIEGAEDDRDAGREERPVRRERDDAEGPEPEQSALAGQRHAAHRTTPSGSWTR